jgi:hypothetical protein
LLAWNTCQPSGPSPTSPWLMSWRTGDLPARKFHLPPLPICTA